MTKRDTANLVLNVRRDRKQEALQGALLVPWRQLAEGAAAFAEWHMIILWVRVITETADQLPEIVQSAFQSRCPGFLERQSREQEDKLPIWKSLEECVTAHCFARARAEGWFDALIYYAYGRSPHRASMDDVGAHEGRLAPHCAGQIADVGTRDVGGSCHPQSGLPRNREGSGCSCSWNSGNATPQ